MQFTARKPPFKEPPLVWAFIPYWNEEGYSHGDSYDNETTKSSLASAFHALDLPWIWQPVTMDTVGRSVAQVSRARTVRECVVFNLCDGTDDDVYGAPGISVIRALENAGIPFTGADSAFYHVSTSKMRLKELLRSAGVDTPPYEIVPSDGPVSGICGRLAPPLLVKPSVSAASYGISLKSVVGTDEEIESRRNDLKSGETAAYFANDDIFVERFIKGLEFTLFVGGSWERPGELWTLPPAMCFFNESLPLEERFLTYDRTWGAFREESAPASGAFYRYDACPTEYRAAVEDIGKRAFVAVRGRGYGRVDMRMDASDGRLYVLEVNANCELSGDRKTPSGCMLGLADLSYADLVGAIIKNALGRM